MFGSDILDIVIGMIFVFLMLSLVCSGANEFIEALLKNRAKYLERGIGELLGDPKNTTGFIKVLYNHGLVNSLFKGRYEDNNQTDLPSYIPARNFALAVMDLARNPPAGMKLPGNLETALRTFQDAAAGDAAKYQASLENWFDSSMDRVSGWYKRRSQGIIFVLGLGVAVAVNADTLYIGQALSNDASLRKGLVAAAQARAAKVLTTTDTSPSAQQAEQKIREDLGSFKNLGLPLGWPAKPDDPKPPAWVPDAAKRLNPQHWLGWLITAIAISLGAPFWFDMLNKFIVIRSTVKPHEKSGEEGSKDATSGKT
jgi:hypothetical protein